MRLPGKAGELLEEVFGDRKEAAGRGQAGTRGSPKAPNALKKKPTEKNVLTEFESMEDWILSMVLVAVMHANPGMTPEESIKEGKEWVRRLYMPRTDHLWRRQITRMHRHGIRAEASKIRREMFKLI